MREGDIIARARSALGAPFRLHGRDLATGVDCVGLAALALGKVSGVPTGYALRGGSIDACIEAIRALCLTRRRGEPRRGDLLLMMAGPHQFHLGLWTGEGLIHADANARRVVERPGAPPWRIIAAWHNHRRKG